MTQRTPAHVMIYDGACPICTQAAQWFAKRATRESVELLPCQDVSRSRRFPLITRQACMEAIYLVTPEGEVLAGARALGRLLALVPGWRWLGWFVSLPGVSRLAPYGYRWVAKRRYRLSAFLGAGCPHGSERQSSNQSNHDIRGEP